MWNFLDKADTNTYNKDLESEFSEKIIDFIQKNPQKFLYD